MQCAELSRRYCDMSFLILANDWIVMTRTFDNSKRPNARTKCPVRNLAWHKSRFIYYRSELSGKTFFDLHSLSFINFIHFTRCQSSSVSGIGIFLTIDLILRLRWDPAQMLPRSTECLEGRGVLLTRIQWNIKSTPELHHSATNSACTHALKKVESQRPSTSPRSGWNRLGVVNTIKPHTGIPGRRFQHVWSQNVLRWYAGNCHIGLSHIVPGEICTPNGHSP